MVSYPSTLVTFTFGKSKSCFLDMKLHYIHILKRTLKFKLCVKMIAYNFYHSFSPTRWCEHLGVCIVITTISLNHCFTRERYKIYALTRTPYMYDDAYLDKIG